MTSTSCVALLHRAAHSLAQFPKMGLPVAEPAASAEGEATSTAQNADASSSVLRLPFTWEEALQWLILNGPKIIAILVAMWILKIVVRRMADRLMRLIGLATGRGSKLERENRANTLTAVFRNTANVLILVGGLLMIMQVLSIPIAPLLGGVAVVGLAVAFGAQNLIRDYFTGATILMEDQYGVNDVVTIGGISGLVERISLRMTVLRDIEGTAHFIPHGQVTTVSNRTHGWSRALFDIGVAYKENIDQVIETLLEIAREARGDDQIGPLITDDPEMLGVDQLGDSAVVVRFFIRTKPLQQWTVKRALLQRIKNRFDELGIKIPFPHRTIYLRPEGELAIETRQSKNNGAE